MAQLYWKVGALASCDIVVDHPKVSGIHLEIQRSGDHYLVTDLDSSNGSTVNGRPIGSVQAQLNDDIGLGPCHYTLEELLAMANKAGHRTKSKASKTYPPFDQPKASESLRQTIRVGNQVHILGRSSRCDTIVEQGLNKTVSGQHACVFRNAGRLIVEDMGSMSGTFLVRDGHSQAEMIRYHVLKQNDRIRIGNTEFTFLRPEPMSDTQPGQRIDVVNLSYSVRNNSDIGPPLVTLLHDINLSVMPGEVVGIMGPSGSGKTTLLNLIAGYRSPKAGEGSVRLNGVPIHSGGQLDTQMGRLIGHAPQFDVLHAQLTVEETLAYTARLRGPTHWTDNEIQQAIDHALRDVQLEDKRHIKVGSPEEKTLSGGQRKRVNIAMELVTGCRILLLDEPTSGLSSHDSAELMQTLRNLADKGCAVILTIHQPAYDAFLQMDHLLLLEEGGHTAYFGPTAKDSFEYFGAYERDADLLLRQLERKADKSLPGKWATRFRQNDASHGKWSFVQMRIQGMEDESVRAEFPAPEPPRMPSVAAQTAVLLSRLWKLKFRDSGFKLLATIIPLIVAFIFAVGLGTELQGDSERKWAVEHAMLVVLTIMSCFFGSMGTVLELVNERAVWWRERRSGVSAFAYLSAKVLVYGLVCLVFPVLAMLGVVARDTVSDGADVLYGEFASYWAPLAATYLCAVASGLALSAFVASRKSASFNLAIYLAVVFSIVQVLFAAFAPLHVTFSGEDKPSEDVAERATTIVPDEEKKSPSAEWLGGLSTATTARWAMSGLVSAHDICPPKKDDWKTYANPLSEEAKDQQVEKVSHQLSRESCKLKYHNAGVHPAVSEEERTSKSKRVESVLANVVISFLALMASLVLVKRGGES